MRKRDGQTCPNFRSRRGIAWKWPLLALVLVASLGLLVWNLTRDPPGPPPAPKPPEMTWDVTERARFRVDHVLPAIAKADQANRAAADRAVKRLRATFQKYRDKVPAFSEDLMSLSTRFGIVRRMPVDWWNETHEVQQFIQGKFETHLFSEAAFREELNGAIQQFFDDVNANENEMLASIKAAVEKSDLPSGQLAIDNESFARLVNSWMQAHAQSLAEHNLTRSLITEIASGTAGSAATSLVVHVAIRVGASAAATGGATAGGAAGGAAGGSSVGPVGTVVGALVGLIVGIAIDWYLTEQFEQKTTAAITAQINQIEKLLLEPIEITDGAGKLTRRPGLIEALEEFNKVRATGYRDALFQQLHLEPQT